MAENFSLGIVIGATLANSVGQAFHTIESKFKSLETKAVNLTTTKAFANRLKSYENTIENLQKQREEYLKLGKATDEIERKIEIYRLKLKELKREAVNAGISIKDLRQDTEKLGNAFEETKRKMKIKELAEETGIQALKLGGVVATGSAVIGAVVKPAIDFESAFADVKKVVDFANKEQEEQFKKMILDMSLKIPLSAGELAKIAASGGQLGIDIKDLPKFTELVAKMATAFDMSAEEAGDAFAKLSNIYGLTMEQAQELGDAINALGNNTAAKERDIINVLGRVGGIAKQFGLAKESVAALSATFLSLGRPPEVAATGINALLLKLNTIDSQSKGFREAFEKVMPIEQFKELQRQNPETALLTFLNALKQLDKEAQANLIAQMFGAEYSDDIAALVSSSEQLAKSLDVIADKKKYQGALDKEFAARSATTANNIQLLKNRIEKLAITLGSVLLPPLNTVISIISDGITSITSFIERHTTLQKVVSYGAVAFFGLAAAGLMLGIMFNTVKIAALSFSGSLKAVYTAGLWAGRGLLLAGKGVLWFGRALMLNPIGLAITAIATLGFAAYMVIKHWDKVKAFFGSLWEWIKQGFSKIAEFVKSIWEHSMVGQLFKAGQWLYEKLFGKTQSQQKPVVQQTTTQQKPVVQQTTTQQKPVVQQTTTQQKQIKKIESQQKIKVEFDPIKIQVDGMVKVGDKDLLNKLASMLEEKINKNILDAIRKVQENQLRRAY